MAIFIRNWDSAHSSFEEEQYSRSFPIDIINPIDVSSIENIKISIALQFWDLASVIIGVRLLRMQNFKYLAVVVLEI